MNDLEAKRFDALVAELRADAKKHGDLLPDRAADAITTLRAENDALRQQIAAVEAAATERAAVALDTVVREWSCGHPSLYCDCDRAGYLRGLREAAAIAWGVEGGHRWTRGAVQDAILAIAERAEKGGA